MKFETAKAELGEGVGALIGCLRIEESDPARRCVTYFERISDALSTIRAPVVLRCLARDRLAGRMAIARSNRFSAVATERLRSLVDLAKEILTGLEVPFEVSWGEGDLIILEPGFELPFEGMGESERRLIRRLSPAKAEELFELTTLWCLSSVNGLVINQDLLEIQYWSLERRTHPEADMAARAVVRDSNNWAVYLGYDQGFALPQSLLRQFTREILLESYPLHSVVISLPLEWVFIQFEGILGVGRPRPGVSFAGDPPSSEDPFNMG